MSIMDERLARLAEDIPYVASDGFDLTSIKSCNRHIIVSTIVSTALSYIGVLIVKVMSSLSLLGNIRFTET